jgi:outer membrane protein assembly factor BamB
MNCVTFRLGLALAASSLFSMVPLAGKASAQLNANAVSQVGLMVAWETNIGGAPLANGPRSFAIWPHSTAKREFVTVRLGNRILERISGDEIDQAAIDRAILKGEALTQAPRLGLAGATARAEKLAATYKQLGKTLQLEPFSQRLTYIVTLTSNGILSAIDAETGSVLWKAEAGDSRLESYGPGVSDESVVATNGNSVYVFDLTTGNLLASRKLAFTPTGTPTAVLGKAVVPSIEGRLIAYDIANAKIPPIVLRSGSENRLGVARSADRDFLAWSMGSKLFMAKIGESPRLWTSIALGEPVANVPVTSQNGFVFCGREGTVVHCTTERDDSILWRTRLAVQVSKAPVVGQNLALIMSDDGLLFALDLKTGISVWEQAASNIKEVVSIGKQHAYVTNSSNALVALDLTTGLETSRAPVVTPTVLPNSISDRLYFITPKGQLTCLRETSAVSPTFVADFQNVQADTDKKTPSTENAADDKATTETSLLEGDAVMQDATTEAANPFGIDPF